VSDFCSCGNPDCVENGGRAACKRTDVDLTLYRVTILSGQVAAEGYGPDPETARAKAKWTFRRVHGRAYIPRSAEFVLEKAVPATSERPSHYEPAEGGA